MHKMHFKGVFEKTLPSRQNVANVSEERKRGVETTPSLGDEYIIAQSRDGGCDESFAIASKANLPLTEAFVAIWLCDQT